RKKYWARDARISFSIVGRTGRKSDRIPRRLITFSRLPVSGSVIQTSNSVNSGNRRLAWPGTGSLKPSTEGGISTSNKLTGRGDVSGRLTDMSGPFYGALQPKPFGGFHDLTTSLLNDLKGRTTVSKQYMLDATNRADLKQPERDLFRELLNEEG